VYIRSKAAKRHIYYQIVEAVRDGERVRQRVVLALGRTPDPRVALEGWRRDVKALRLQRAFLAEMEWSSKRSSKTAGRLIAHLDARIAETESKVERLAGLIKSKSIGTTPTKRKDRC
jgi:hypothetical protein